MPLLILLLLYSYAALHARPVLVFRLIAKVVKLYGVLLLNIFCQLRAALTLVVLLVLKVTFPIQVILFAMFVIFLATNANKLSLIVPNAIKMTDMFLLILMPHSASIYAQKGNSKIWT